MLWTTIAIPSGILLIILAMRDLIWKRWASVEAYSVLLVIWCANGISGAVVFKTVEPADFWVWKPLLSISAFVYVGLLVGALRVHRRYAKDADTVDADARSAETEKTITASIAISVGLALASFLAGTAAVASIWQM